MSTFFISDLHLSDERPDLTRAFVDFTEQQASQADALYILGDFFDAWVGDDAVTATSEAAINAIRALVEADIPVFMQWGNRDFLLGEGFMRQSRATLLPGIQVIQPYSQPLLIMHGDELCTDDHDYQRFRQMVRSPEWQAEFLAKPLHERQAIARDLRKKSREAQQLKAENITDVNADAVTKVMSEHNVDILIHGHTHRPHIHHLQNNKLRIVLGDWDTTGWCLEWHNDDSHELHQFTF